MDENMLQVFDSLIKDAEANNSQTVDIASTSIGEVEAEDIRLTGIRSVNEASLITRTATTPAFLEEIRKLHSLRPNLLRSGQLLDDGRVLRYVIPSIANDVKVQGWYADGEDGLEMLPSDPENWANSSSDFHYGEINDGSNPDIRIDHILIAANDEKIQALASDMLLKHKKNLQKTYSLHTLFVKSETSKKGKGISYFITIDQEGCIKSVMLHGMDQNYSVASKHVRTIAQSVVLMDDIKWDIYKRRLIRGGVPLSERMLKAIGSECSSKYGINLSPSEFKNNVEACAESTPINTLHQRLMAIEQKGDAGLLEYVDVKNIASSYLKPAGTDGEIALANEMVFIWLSGMVLRMQYPGIPFRYMLILVGQQDGGKTAFFQILGGKGSGDAEFDLVELPGLTEGDKGSTAIRGVDVRKMMTSHSVALINEVDACFKDVSVQSMRDFVSRTDESFIDKYEKSEQKRGRTAVLAGTANEIEFLQDISGNTRFWIIPTQLDESNQLDFKRLEDQREAIIYWTLVELRKIKSKGGMSALKNLSLSEASTSLNERLNRERLDTGDLTSYVEDYLYMSEGGASLNKRKAVVSQRLLKSHLKTQDVDFTLNDIRRTLKALDYKEYAQPITYKGKRKQTVWIPLEHNKPEIDESNNGTLTDF